MNHLWQDVRYGVRMLLSKPGFAAAAVLVLALGIGANSAVFTLINAFLFKPLHIQRSEELRGLYSRDVKHPDSYRAFSYPNYVDIRDNNPVFSSVLAYNLAMVGFQEGDTTRRGFAATVSSNFFSTLGTPLWKGRSFLPEEEKPGGELTAIVSYSYWRKTGQDPQIIGKQLHINGRLFTVIGIAPEGFTGTTALISPEVFVPLGAYALVMNDFEGTVKPLAARDNAVLIVVGRLNPGLTQSSADARLAVVAAQMEKAFPAENKDQTLIARPLSRLSITTNPSNDDDLRLPAILLLSLAAIVLLIASLNLANMMMATGAARRKEIAIRLAIGGGRRRIVRQLVTEGLLLAILGGMAGLFVASWSTTLLIGSMSRLVPLDLIYDATPDVRVLAVTFTFCVFATVIFGLFPAWKLSRPDVWIDLKENAGEDSAGHPRRLFSRSNILVMAQLALSLMMIVAAGLFIRSAVSAANVQPGFSLDHQMLAEVDASLMNYDEAHSRQLYAALTQRLRQVPGVQSVALAASVPFGMLSLGKSITPSGVPPSKEHPAVGARFNIVTEDYFQTLGIPLLRGRTFVASESTPESKPHVAILDQRAAEKLWPAGDALGKHIRLDEGDSGGHAGVSVSNEEPKQSPDLEVVGIVGNTLDNILGSEKNPHVYVPLGQQFQADTQIHLKVAPGSPEAESRLLETIRREIRAADSRLPLLALKSMRTHLDAGVDVWVVRTGAHILEVFGGVALFLAVIGLYAVNAYTVSRRTREIGIRMALGADASRTLGMVLREGLRVTAVGMAVGLVLAIGLAKLLAGFLYDVRSADPVVFFTAPALLAIVALCACYFPARRAARVDPMVALRDL